MSPMVPMLLGRRRGTRVSSRLRIWGQEFESLQARHLIKDLAQGSI
jgi:hypothetical protein